MSSSKMKKFVSIKGVIDNLRQSVNTPSPPGANGATTGRLYKLKLSKVDFHHNNVVVISLV